MIGDLDLGLGVTTTVNGPGAPSAIARAVLDFLRARAEGSDARLPEIPDPAKIPNADAYIASYTATNPALLSGRPARFAVSGGDGRLTLTAGDRTLPLRGLDDEVLAAEGCELDRFPLVALRDGDEIVGWRNGDVTYARDGATLPEEPPLPAELVPCVGHYRSHNPWTPDVRVVAGDGRLWLIVPGDADGLDDRQPLVPLPNGWFRCGADERIPERICFDVVVEGRALIANLNGCEFYRRS
jgi:hypothetical protein